MTFSQIVKKYRLKRNLNQSQLSELSNVSQATISKIERKVNPADPHLTVAARLCAALKLDMTKVIKAINKANKS